MRYQGFGMLPDLQLIMVAFVIREEEDGTEYIHPICVRKATKYDQENFYS